MTDKNNEREAQTPAGVEAALASPAPGPVKSCCPQCGGPVKQTWRDVSTLVCATFCVTLMFAPVLFFMAIGGGGRVFAILGLVVGAIAVLSFWAMPAVGALAVVVRPRCRSCGHRLHTRLDDPQRSTEAPFPKRLAIIGSAILLVILAVSLLWLRTAPGLETSVMGLRPYLWIILAGFAFGLGLLSQAMVWRRWRARMMGTGREGCVLLLATLVVGAGWLALTAGDYCYLSRTYDPVKRAPQVLDRAGLAPLPPSARDVRVYSWAFLLSGQFALRFAAEPSVIEQFLTASPSLKGVTCRTYSTERMRLPAHSTDDLFAHLFSDRPSDGHDYYDPNLHSLPDWYHKSIRDLGRRYEISWYEGKFQGELIVDDTNYVVYVHVSRF